MCGIAGIIDFQKLVSELDIRSICDKLVSRGPDAAGYFVEERIALGHRRLSILDLATGDQPMYSLDKNIVIVFNGEIYNYQEVKEELLSYDRTFNTTSDTEVIIAAYEHFGIDKMLDKIEGMFAFAIYDRKIGHLYIARDRFGEKPLYYLLDEDKLVFASELKAIEPLVDITQIDKDAVNLFLSLSYIPAPFTIYESVRKLMPSTYMVINMNGKVEEVKYYDLLKSAGEAKIESFEKAKQSLHDLLFDAVRKRMVADVGFGSFLSGGIDSSIITAVMSKISNQAISTYTIGFTEKEYDESERAQLVADFCKSNHTVHYLDYKDVVNDIDSIIGHFDEPFGDSSAIPSNYVAQLAAKSVKMVLTGDAADEIFGGYEKYLAEYYSDKYKNTPPILRKIFEKAVEVIPHSSVTNSILRRVKKVINNSGLSAFDLHYEYMCLGFNDNERRSLLHNDYFKETKSTIRKYFDERKNTSDLERGFYTDLNIVLEGDMLTKVDRMCMKSSLEARVPFLDRRIVELAYQMPASFKINGRDKKHILKRTFGYLLPKVTLGYRKKGFGVPVDYWLRNELKDELHVLLHPAILKKQGIFNQEYIGQILNEHLAGKANHKGKLWNLFVFQKWYNQRFNE
jgi:asparagine synthase (glutamine-hydrolysing)